MQKYEILEHPADLKIRVFGKDLPEVFVNAALAMAEQQTRNSEIKKFYPERSRRVGNWETVEIESADLESLLVDWLSEILYRGEVNKKVYFDFAIKEFQKTKLRGKIKGVAVQQKSLDIKAATYHDLSIKKTGQYWRATLIFDI
ncbi:archease [Patescibacteria group bacterium]|nr:archease [Patescibacteria group bacterium]